MVIEGGVDERMEKWGKEGKMREWEDGVIGLYVFNSNVFRACIL
jgi:hypothetical protein